MLGHAGPSREQRVVIMVESWRDFVDMVVVVITPSSLVSIGLASDIMLAHEAARVPRAKRNR